MRLHKNIKILENLADALIFVCLLGSPYPDIVVVERQYSSL